MRTTNQKKILAEELQKLKQFFDAADFHSKANKRDHKIGIATVYRFLKDLEKKGELHSYICGKRKIYSLDQKSHTHFVCEQCGKKKHLNIKKIDFLEKISGKVCHFQLDITGLCEECLRSLH